MLLDQTNFRQRHPDFKGQPRKRIRSHASCEQHFIVQEVSSTPVAQPSSQSEELSGELLSEISEDLPSSPPYKVLHPQISQQNDNIPREPPSSSAVTPDVLQPQSAWYDRTKLLVSIARNPTMARLVHMERCLTLQAMYDTISACWNLRDGEAVGSVAIRFSWISRSFCEIVRDHKEDYARVLLILAQAPHWSSPHAENELVIEATVTLA